MPDIIIASMPAVASARSDRSSFASRFLIRCAAFSLRRPCKLAKTDKMVYIKSILKAEVFTLDKEQLLAIQKIFNESKYMVFLGGAGVSTESGIPDFRSTDGLYNQKYDYPPEVILSKSFFDADPETFYRFFWDKMVYPDAKPNAAHRALAELERAGKLKLIATQNIDGLHQMAGAHNVLELHGSVWRSYCTRCGKPYTLAQLKQKEGVPHCDECGGIIRPDVVLYEEPLNMGVLRAAAEAISRADTLIVGGTSLLVYPAAGLIDYFGGENLILINRDATPRDSMATHLVKDNIGDTLSQIVK